MSAIGTKQTSLVAPHMSERAAPVVGRGYFGDADVMDVAQLALCGLVQRTAKVALNADTVRTLK